MQGSVEIASMSKWVGRYWPSQSEYNSRKWHGAHSYCQGRFRKQGKMRKVKPLHKVNVDYQFVEEIIELTEIVS
jgi:hypothetical protein